MKLEKTLLTLPKAILFDWDSTLVNSFQIIKKAINEALTYFGEPTWSDTEIRKHTQLSAKDGLPLWFGDRWPKALEIFTECYQQNTQLLAPLPGALPLLQSNQHRNIPMAVISNKRGKILRHEITQLGWDSFFQIAIGSGDLQEDKPSPLPVHYVLDKLGLPANHHVWFVGDAPVDWRCAEAAGCLPIPIGSEVNEAKNYPQCVTDCLELEKILRKT